MAKQKHTAQSMECDIHDVLARAMEVFLYGDSIDRDTFCCYVIGYLHRCWTGLPDSEELPSMKSPEFAAKATAFIAEAQTKYLYSPMRQPPRSPLVGAEQAGDANKKEIL